MITVIAGIIRKENKILIARRSPKKHLGGLWEFPGGKIENGETPEECLSRELKEELGIKVNSISYFMENIHQYGERTILLKAYNCDYVNGNILFNDHDKVEWVESSELGNYEFAPADIPFIIVLDDGK